MVGYKRKKDIGLMGGSLISSTETQPKFSRVSMVNYDKETHSLMKLTDPQVLKGLKDKEGVTWIAFTGQLQQHWIDSLEEVLQIHPLVIEDIVNAGQRPKVEEFDDHLFLTLKTFFSSEKANTIKTQQLSIVLGENYVLTFQNHPNELFDDVLQRIKSGKGRIRGMGPDYLTYRLVDSVVDSYFNVIDKVGDAIETIEDRLMAEPEEQVLYDIHSLKRDMIFLRRSIWPMREVVGTLSRDRTSMINPETEVFYRDIYDHTIQVIDTIETFRDMLSGMLDLYLSSLSNKMNEVMKVLTIIATIFIPLTFIAGIYGMNFDPDASPLNMPELGWYFGYPFAMGSMVIIAIIMLIFFRKKKWI